MKFIVTEIKEVSFESIVTAPNAEQAVSLYKQSKQKNVPEVKTFKRDEDIQIFAEMKEEEV